MEDLCWFYHHYCWTINGLYFYRKVLVILSLTIIVNGREVGEKIGDPKLFEEGDNSAPIPREPSVPQPVSNRNATMNGNWLSFSPTSLSFTF